MDEFTQKIIYGLGGAALSACFFLYKERRAQRKESSERRRQADITTLASLREVMPEKLINAFRDLEPYSGFPQELIHILSNFLETFGNRGVIFHDPELNELARSGVTAVSDFVNNSMALCVPVGNRYATCRPNAHHSEKQRFAEDAKRVYQTGLAVQDQFHRLFDLARSQLDI